MARPIKRLSPFTPPPLYGTSPPSQSDDLINGSGCVFEYFGRIPENLYIVDSFNSALEEAVYKNDVEHVKELLTAEPVVAVTLRFGKMTCLEFCSMMGRTDMLKILIELSENAKTLQQYFSLNDIVDRAYMISRNKRIFFGQEALKEANRYEAALFTAVQYNQPECVRVMLPYLGALEPGRHAFFLEDDCKQELTASELAQVRGHTECFEIIQKHRANQANDS